MSGTVLVVNAGSSSIKFQLFERSPGGELGLEFKGQMEGIGTKPHLLAKDAQGQVLVDDSYERGQIASVADAMDQLESWLAGQLNTGQAVQSRTA